METDGQPLPFVYKPDKLMETILKVPGIVMAGRILHASQWETGDPEVGVSKSGRKTVEDAPTPLPLPTGSRKTNSRRGSLVGGGTTLLGKKGL
jgi:hypothetical protein